MKKKVVNLNLHLFEREQLCTYFHDMALQGWMLTNMKYSWMIFSKTAPQDVTFVIDIYPKGNYMNPYNIDQEQIAYSEFIEAYGYERIALTGNYHVYRIKKETIPIHNEESTDRQKERKKTILKYEAYNHVFILLLGLLFLINPAFHLDNIDVYESNGTFLLHFVPLIFILMCILKAGPSVLWIIRQNHYHPPYHHILKRERYFQVLWWIMLIMFIISLLSTNKSANILVSMLVIIIFTIICFYGLDLLFTHITKRFHGIISIICTTYLLTMLLINPAVFILPAPSPRTSQDPVISIQNMNQDITSIANTEIQEKDSIFLHIMETWEEYSDPITNEGTVQNDRKFFSCKVYTIKDTILADYLKELILQKDIYEPYLIKKSEEWTCYGTNRSTHFILKDHCIIMLDYADLQEHQISLLIGKLDM